MALSFGKTFNVYESMKFEVRAVAQNALNRPNFYGPDATIAPSSYTDASLTTLKTPNSIAQVS